MVQYLYQYKKNNINMFFLYPVSTIVLNAPYFQLLHR